MSSNQNFTNIFKRLTDLVLMTMGLCVLAGFMTVYLMVDPSLALLQAESDAAETVTAEDPNRIENGIHVRTGLVEGEGLMAVVNNCTGCHSAKLVTQNRMNAERWNSTIKWMQETQNLWDLGENHEVIVNYLVTYYPPKIKGRRERLSDIKWYALED